MSVKIVTAREAVDMIRSGSTVCSQGMGGNGVAEELMLELENRFLSTGKPCGLRWVHSSGQGNRGGKGLNHIGHEGLLSWIVGGHYNPAPRIQQLIIENQIEAYNLPQGVISVMFRDIAARRPTISRIGLNTFVDPRFEGGRLNSRTTEDIVQVITVTNQEYLMYRQPTLDYALLRGTYADERGNISMEGEACYLESLQAAQAVKNCGGKVIVQVKELVRAGTIDPRLVKIPGVFVDYVVPVQDTGNHMMTFDLQFDPSLCGDCKRITTGGNRSSKLDARKIICRRAAGELEADAIINLGIGIPEGIGIVAEEEGVRHQLTLSIESGPVGGIPVSGIGFGASMNPEAILDQSTQFDTYDGGGLDMAFLGMAEADGRGNINVSKFGPRIAGAGGFINITQSTSKVVFCGSFTAGGLKVCVKDGKLQILEEGTIRKFVKTVQQITFNGEYAAHGNQEILYITERAVFRLTSEGIILTELAPGVDIKRHILDQMDCSVLVSDCIRPMDDRIFRDGKMGLKLRIRR